MCKAKCFICDCVGSSLYVYVLPDPYYGYGYEPKLVCDKCKQLPCDVVLEKLGSPFYVEKHVFDMIRDGYMMGLHKKKPLPICYGCNTGYSCHICKKEIRDSWTILPGELENSVYTSIMNGDHCDIHTLCMKCATEIWERADDSVDFVNQFYCCSNMNKYF